MSEQQVIPPEFLPPVQHQRAVTPPKPPLPKGWTGRRIGAGVLVLLASVLLLLSDYPDRGFAFRSNPEAEESAAHKLVVMSQLVALLQSNYAYPDRLQPKKMLYAALVGVQEELDSFLVRPALDLEDEELEDSDIPSPLTIQYGALSMNFGIDKVTDVYAMTWKMMEILASFPISSDLADKMQDAAINGMLSVLDPHTSYMSATEYGEMKVSTKGSFGGLGIVISVRDGKLTVVSVMPNTPAARHGIKKNDRIVQINEESSINMTVNEAAGLMRGDPGTPVDLTIMRDGYVKPERLSMTREVIKVKSVATETMAGDIAYIRVKGFQEDSAQEVASFLASAYPNKVPRGIILDLRGNSGGVMSAALDMADLFMSTGTILTTVERGLENPESEKAGAGEPYEETPLVLLVDHGSASASEIVAGALKYTDRAVIIGERTFGKGSVQYVEELQKGAVKMTVAQYLGPHMEIIQGMGIEPHVELKPMTQKRWVSPPSFIDSFEGEGALPYHLKKAGTRLAEQPPLYHLRYVVPLETEENADLVDEALLDWQAQLAWDMLDRAGAPSASGILENSETVLNDHEAEQDFNIDSLAATEGKTWTRGEIPAGARLELSAAFNPFPIVAGVESWLTVTVTNHSDVAVPMLYARTDCDDSRITGRTCIIGTLEAGETAECAIRFKPAEGGMARTDRLWVDLLAGLDEYMASTELVSQIQTTSPPAVGLTWFLRDDLGNRNGLPDVGETLSVGLRVTNIGEGILKGGLAVMKNLSGPALYLTKGRSDLPDLKPGDSATVNLELTVQKEPQDGFWKFDVGVADPNGRRHFAATNELAFPAAPERSNLVSGYVAASKDPLVLHTAPYEDSPVCARYTGDGVLPFDASFRDFYRIVVPNGVVGWVAREDVSVASAGPLPRALTAYTAVEPRFTITRSSVSSQIGKASQIELDGLVDFGDAPPVSEAGVSVYDQGIKVDMTYFGDLKPHAGPIPFHFTIPLREGANSLVLVGYQDKRTAGYYSMFYYRIVP